MSKNKNNRPKENLSRFMKNSDIRKCLKKYLLNQ